MGLREREERMEGWRENRVETGMEEEEKTETDVGGKEEKDGGSEGWKEKREETGIEGVKSHG